MYGLIVHGSLVSVSVWISGTPCCWCNKHDLSGTLWPQVPNSRVISNVSTGKENQIVPTQHDPHDPSGPAINSGNLTCNGNYQIRLTDPNKQAFSIPNKLVHDARRTTHAKTRHREARLHASPRGGGVSSGLTGLRIFFRFLIGRYGYSD